MWTSHFMVYIKFHIKNKYNELLTFPQGYPQSKWLAVPMDNDEKHEKGDACKLINTILAKDKELT